MHISVIGTNGLLSSQIAAACDDQSFKLSMYGRTEPKSKNYSDFHKVDLLNDQLNYEEIKQSDVIIYAAGAGIQYFLKDNAHAIYHLNVTVPVQICYNLKQINYKGTFISFGSYSEIGEMTNNRLFTEEDVLQSQFAAPNDYTVSKRMLSRFFSSFNAPFTFLHFILPTIYGENESNHRLIPYTLKSIYKNTELNLTSGEQIRQYIYINDAVDILFRSIKVNLPSGIYNITGVEDLSVKELVTMLFALNGKALPEGIFGKAERADVGMKVLRLNGEKLQKYIGITPASKISEIYNKYNVE